MTRCSWLLLALPLLAGCAGAGLRSGTPTPVVSGNAEVQAFAEMDRVRVDVHGVTPTGPVEARITSEADGSTLWSGTLDAGNAVETPGAPDSWRVDGLSPDLWEPTSPHLYRLALDVPTADGVQRTDVRFGFRSFAERDGRLYLNGRPYFLRGLAINPPGRTLPDSLEENRRFAESYVRYLLGQNINIIRLSQTSQTWLDVCDELGMMVFQGNYGTPDGATPRSAPDKTPDEIAAWYRDDVLGPLASHPSVVIYVLANEQASVDIPYLNTNADQIEAYLTRAYRDLQTWDSTRPYIGNAGYGLGRSGDLNDIHRYWGWYYNSVLSFYTLRDPDTYRRVDRIQPITLSENTGNYTGVDGRFNLVSDTKQPDSQLNWTGHAPDAEQAERALAYQAFVAGSAIEITRRARAVNPYLAGLMPFTIPFFEWYEITRFEDMGPKPVFDQMGTSYQPVLLSWELWTPQVYAGSTIRPVAHVVNDAEDGRDLSDARLDYEVVGPDGATVLAGRQTVGRVPYYAAQSQRLAVALPAGLPTGDYTLRGTVSDGGEVVSRNETPLFVAEPSFAGRAGGLGRTIRLYDPAGTTADALRRLAVPFEASPLVAGLDPAADLLVIGADAADEALGAQTDALRSFVAAGGRVLVLRQSGAFDTSWLPARVERLTEPLDHSEVFPEGRPYRDAMAVNPERTGHPVFDGLDRDRVFLWSDPTGWDQTAPGFPAVYPVTHGFMLTDSKDLEHAAILADYGHGLQGVALAELFDGDGSVLLSGFDMVSRVGLDPAADRLLTNAIRYQASAEPHHAHPLLEAPIVWGDYESEGGLVTGVTSGLIVHTVPIVPEGLAERYPIRVDDEGYVYAGGEGGWNSKPAVQYVARGRRPFGPYTFTIGGSQQLADDAGPEGEGSFWGRLPAGRTRMVTTIENTTAQALGLTVVVNGEPHPTTIPAGSTHSVETPLDGAGGTIGVTYRGDRRLVLLDTRFDTSTTTP